jgi:hypothetical protein
VRGILPVPMSTRAIRMRRLTWAVVGLSSLALLGCAPEGRAAAEAAQEFHHDLTSGDLSTACSMLASQALEKAGGAGDCEEQLQSVQLQGSEEAPLQTEIFGRDAMVKFEHDVVFLVASGSGWKVSGCTPQGKSPYKCQIGGK